MSSRPVCLKRPGSSSVGDNQLTCIVHYSHCSETEIRELTESQFETLSESVRVRQLQLTSGYRLDDICSQFPSQFNCSLHGCHRWCYKNFTNISRLKNKLSEDVTSVKQRSSERQQLPKTGTLFPQNECIFCRKERKYPRGSATSEPLVKCVTVTAEHTIKEAAAAKFDFELLGRITNEDLRAKEARYHEYCRREYTRANVIKEPPVHDTTDNKPVQSSVREAYSDVFDSFTTYIEKEIICNGKVETMTMLNQKYLAEMKSRYPEIYNPEYPTQALKNKIIGHFGDRLKFWLPKSHCKSELVFAANVDIGQAVELAFEALSSEATVLANAAAILRRDIKTFSDFTSVPWPPSAHVLESLSPPHSVINFLSTVTTGKKIEKVSERVARVCTSIAEDICYASSAGKLPLKKHFLLGMSMRHLTGSADVVTILNRYGHSISYTKLLELETAMAQQVKLTDGLLPSNISVDENSVSHVCWDNFDLNEETPSGSNTTHSTHGIVIQETSGSSAQKLTTELVQVAKSKKRSIKFEPTAPHHVVLPKKVEPVLLVNVVSETVSVRLLIAQNAVLNWVLCRSLYNEGCTVPDWSGWVSQTADASIPVNKSIIGYLNPIQQPITQMGTVYQCLKTSIDVSAKLGQRFTFVTFDLAAAKLALNAVWNEPEKFRDVIVNLGAFHTVCAYMGALGKLMEGSGFEELVLEAGLCASGSLQQMMNGKHYNRALRVHQTMADALGRLMTRAYLSNDMSNQMCIEKLKSLASFPNNDTLTDSNEDHESKEFLDKFSDFVDNIRSGSLGKTAQFWAQYHDSVWIMLLFIKAVKENNLRLYIQCMRAMCPLIFAADRFHYARYLPLHHAQLENISAEAYELLNNNGISAARSTIPACRIPIDQCIEQTINRSAKSTGGIIGFSKNINAYYRWTLTRHKRAEYLEVMFAELGLKQSDNAKHGSTRNSELKNSECEAKRLTETFDNFLNPFAIASSGHNDIFCLSSGKPTSSTVAKDLLCYVQKGEEATEQFIEDRLKQRTIPFHDRMKKLKLKTFVTDAVKKTLTTSQKKTFTVKAERNLLGHLLLLSQSHDINLQELFQYSLSPIPWSIATGDGCLAKTDKSQLMHVLENELITDKSCNVPESYVSIVDGNALIRSITGLPSSFGEFAAVLFKALPNTEIVHFVTDCYLDNSIKGAERVRRGQSKVHILGGSSTKMPSDFGKFLMESENKQNLIRFLLAQWQSQQYSKMLCNRVVYFVCDDKCLRISSDGLVVSAVEVAELQSTQEEADTRIILHAIHVAKSSDQAKCIVVRSPDTDVFILLIHYSSSIGKPTLFDTGVGDKRRIIDVTSLSTTLGSELTLALPAFHAFTGCDTVSAFVGKGKKRPLQVLRKNRAFITTFQKIGEAGDKMSDDVMKGLANFVCSMYGSPNVHSIGKVRYQLFQSRYGTKMSQLLPAGSSSGIDLSMLPPCAGTLQNHCRRANYQTFIWKNSHIANLALPNPVSCGWKLADDNHLEIDWNDDAIMPQKLVDILEEKSSKQENEDDDMSGQEVEEADVVDNIIDFVFQDEFDD